MRTTVTLDPDVEQLVRRTMREHKVGFKEAINDAIRKGAAQSAPVTPFRTETASMGRSSVTLDRALQLAADLEDDDLLRRQRQGS